MYNVLLNHLVEHILSPYIFPKKCTDINFNLFEPFLSLGFDMLFSNNPLSVDLSLSGRSFQFPYRKLATPQEN